MAIFFIAMFMKIKLALIIIISVILIVPTGWVVAQEIVEDSVGLLPSNPFYFLKEWRRDVRKFFTFSDIRKAELELKVSDEKASELRRLEEIVSEEDDNLEAIKKAIENYQSHLNRLKTRLTSLKETSQNPNVDRLLDNLVENALRHQKLFENLISKFEANEEIREQLIGLKELSGEAVASALNKLDTAEKFKERLKKAILKQTDEFWELRSAELLDIIERHLSGKAKRESSKIKEDLLLKLSGRLEGQALLGNQDDSAVSALEALSGNRLGRLRILDEVREKIINPEVKTTLNIVRQRLLEKRGEDAGIAGEQSLAAIELAKVLAEELELAISSRATGVSAAIKQLLERAKFNLAQAGKLYEEGNYSGSFGQATASQAASKNALSQLAMTDSDFAQDLESLKNQFDGLFAKARGANLNKDNAPKLFELFGDAEKRIVELSKLVNAKAAVEKITIALRNAKLLLATIEELLRATANE